MNVGDWVEIAPEAVVAPVSISVGRVTRVSDEWVSVDFDDEFGPRDFHAHELRLVQEAQ